MTVFGSIGKKLSNQFINQQPKKKKYNPCKYNHVWGGRKNNFFAIIKIINLKIPYQ